MPTIEQTIESPQVADIRMREYEDSTPRPGWSIAANTFDLMSWFSHAEAAAAAQALKSAQRDDEIEAAIEWSLGLRADVGAEALRREAW